ncbi:MAG: hypothetical protein Q9166_007017 [cf. Caloplaca sp. 2 TL-2023]
MTPTSDFAIWPGRINEEMKFYLNETQLDRTSDYQALSYTWGPPNFTCMISSTKANRNVTINIFSAPQIGWGTALLIIRNRLPVGGVCLEEIEHLTDVCLKLSSEHETNKLVLKSARYTSGAEQWQGWWWQTIIGERRRNYIRATVDFERDVRQYLEATDEYFAATSDVEMSNILEMLKQSSV